MPKINKKNILLKRPELQSVEDCLSALKELDREQLPISAHFVGAGRLLSHEDSKVVAKAAKTLMNSRLLAQGAIRSVKQALLNPKISDKIKIYLATFCLSLGRKGVPAAPALTILLKNKKSLPTLRMQCAMALAEFGGRILDQLMDYFDEAPKTVAVGIQFYCSEPERVVPRLIEKTYRSKAIAEAAIEALGWLEGASVKALPRLCELLSAASNPKEAYHPVVSITKICRNIQASLVREALVGAVSKGEILKDAGFYTTYWIANALADQAPEILPDLERMAKSPNGDIRKIVIEAMKEIEENDEHTSLDPKTKALRHQIIALALEDIDSEIRSTALESIRAATSDRGGANLRRALSRLLFEGNEEERREAARALGRIEPSLGPVVVPLLIRALEDAHFMVQYYAIEALANFGAAANSAVSRLREFLTNSEVLEEVEDLWERSRRMHFDLRRAAAETLAKVDAEGVSIPELTIEAHVLPRTLEEYKRWKTQLESLLLLGADVETIVIILDHAMADRAGYVRQGAVSLAGQLKGHPASAIRILSSGLKDRDEDVVTQSCYELRHFDQEAMPLLPRIRQLSSHRSHKIRNMAMNHLLRFDTQTDSWAHILLNMFLAQRGSYDAKHLFKENLECFASVSVELRKIAIDADYRIDVRALCASAYACSVITDKTRDAAIWETLRFALEFGIDGVAGTMKEARGLDMLSTIFKGLLRFPQKSRELIPQISEFLHHDFEWVQAATAECLLSFKVLGG